MTKRKGRLISFALTTAQVVDMQKTLREITTGKGRK